MSNFLVSCAYIYPLCPLSINHAKMFLVADIVARNQRRKGRNVFFPVASHYSGNSAHKAANVFAAFFDQKAAGPSDDVKKTFALYKNVYGTPTAILKTFADPIMLLDFYNQEILWELRSLGISCDYGHSYSTSHPDFSSFVRAIISEYKKRGLLVENKNSDLALDYDDDRWRERTVGLISRTKFMQPFHKNNVLSAVRHVRNDWALLRRNGFGVNYEQWTVDPMFDSEVFTLFDLYMRYKDEHPPASDVEAFFVSLFKALQKEAKPRDELSEKIVGSLPCDVMICEEHLKNWVVKKFYAEEALFADQYRTKKYFMLGMGFLEGKQMSASKGHAILTRDLISCHGPLKARLIMLLTGGHPSKMYEYDKTLPVQAEKLLNDFTAHYTHLLALVGKSAKNNIGEQSELRSCCERIEDAIERGHFRQATIELLANLPRTYYKSWTADLARDLMCLYQKYLGILLPGLLESFGGIKPTGP